MPILAATDGETVPDKTVTTAAELAQQYGEELIVLHVMPTDVFDEHQQAVDGDGSNVSFTFAPGISYRQNQEQTSRSSSGGHHYTIEDGERDAATVAEEVAEETVDSLRDASYSGRVGTPTEEILDVASREDARYIVLGGRKRTPVGKAIFGSVTQSVLLEAERPVVTVMSEG